MNGQTHKHKRSIGTIESTALILSIFSLIILLKIYPNLNPNIDETSSMLVKLEERLTYAETKLDMLDRRVCATKFDKEIASLNSMNMVLEDILSKGDEDIALQTKQIQEQLKKLMDELKQQTYVAKDN